MIGAIKQDYIVDGDDNYGILPGDAPLYERVPASIWAVLTDAEIARRAGVTRERVRQVRNKYGIPPSKLHGKPMVGRGARVLYAVRDEEWAVTTSAELAEKFNLDEHLVSAWRKEHNKPQVQGYAPIAINGFKVRSGGGNEGSS